MEKEDTDPRGDSNDSISDMLTGPELANTLEQWVKRYARKARTNKSIITTYTRKSSAGLQAPHCFGPGAHEIAITWDQMGWIQRSEC